MAKIKLAHSLRRGDSVDVRIESLANGGDGVAKIDGVPVFVDRAAAGDKLRVHLFDVRKDFAKGEIEAILEGSSERATPPCQHYQWCGGCQWQHLSYSAQAAHKQDLVVQALKHIGGMGSNGQASDFVVEPIAAARPGQELHYRNKTQFPVQYVDGQFLAGYYARNSHDLINVEHCSIEPEEMDSVLDASRRLLKKYKVHAYDETTHKGLVRHINLRQSFASGKQLVTIVVNHEPLKFAKFRESEELLPLLDVAKGLVESQPQIEGVVLNFNPLKGNKILGDDSLVLIGTEYVEEILKTERTDMPAKLQEGLRMRLSSSSFFQVNTWQAVTLLEVIADMLRQITPEGSDLPVVIDAYAGVGTIAFWLSSMAKKVIAVEENGEAVGDGQANANLNNIGNIEFIQSRVEDVIARLMMEETPPDVVVVDPPRKGLSAEVLQCIKEEGPRYLIYVSCNPTTLARDLKMLAAPVSEPNQENPENLEERESARHFGYKAKRVKPVDLFPQTYHVETVVLLERF